MKSVNGIEVEKIYRSYSVKNDKKTVKNTLNKGNLDKSLNKDFSSIFGKSFSGNYSSNSTDALT